MDYANLIPTKAPAGLFSFLQTKENKFGRGVLGYKMVSKEEATARMDCEAFSGDFRRDEKGKAALLWCSECERESIAEYIPSAACNGCGMPSGIYLKDDVQQTSGEFADGTEMCCPCCGAEVKLRSKSALRYGDNEQVFVMVPAVRKGKLVLTDYCVERAIWYNRQETTVSPFFAYVVDGKKVVKLVHYRRYMGRGFYKLPQWEQMQKLTDTVGAPYFYDKLPSLAGTNLENAKLWEYKRQAYKEGKFYPIGYIRLYLQKRNVENLILQQKAIAIMEMVDKMNDEGKAEEAGKFSSALAKALRTLAEQAEGTESL